MDKIGKIKRMHIKDVWKHEAQDFTPWLAKNIDELNEVLGMSLDVEDIEHSTLNFRVDLVAKDGERTVVIENQLNHSDHDHLGKIVTYLASLGADAAIWIVREARSEHTDAITWLNQSGLAQFYLVKVEAIAIGDSPPAPMLTLISGPSEESVQVGETRKDLAERQILRKSFWAQLLAHVIKKDAHNIFANISPSTDSWISTTKGLPGMWLIYRVRQHDASVELSLDAGKGLKARNEAVYEYLHERCKEIADKFGDKLEWDRKDNKVSCSISMTITMAGWRTDQDKWPEAHERLADAMTRLHEAVKPHFPEIRKLVKRLEAGDE